jgi:hypothetical protein
MIEGVHEEECVTSTVESPALQILDILILIWTILVCVFICIYLNSVFSIEMKKHHCTYS